MAVEILDLCETEAEEIKRAFLHCCWALSWQYSSLELASAAVHMHNSRNPLPTGTESGPAHIMHNSLPPLPPPPARKKTPTEDSPAQSQVLK